MALVVSMLMI